MVLAERTLEEECLDSCRNCNNGFQLFEPGIEPILVFIQDYMRSSANPFNRLIASLLASLIFKCETGKVSVNRFHFDVPVTVW